MYCYESGCLVSGDKLSLKKETSPINPLTQKSSYNNSD